MRADRRSVAAAALCIAVLAGCTHTSGVPVGRSPSLRLTGTLLVGPGNSFSGVGLYDLADRKLDRVPGISYQQGGFFFFGGPAPAIPGTFVDGSRTAFTMAGSSLFRVQAGGAQRVGPRYRGTMVGATAKDAVATRCFPGQADVSVLDLADPTEWRTLGRLCGHSLSPDGTEVAVTVVMSGGNNILGGPQFLLGSKVWAVRLDGSGPRRQLVDLAAIPALGTAMLSDPQVLAVAWGTPGVAVAVSNGQSGPWALVVVRPAGEPLVIPLGQSEPFDLAWQPNGDLLAFTDCYQCTTFGRNPAHTSDVRLLDPRTGSLRDIASASNFLSGLVWSPDGKVVATGTANTDILFASTSGLVLTHRSLDAVPEDWAP